MLQTNLKVVAVGELIICIVRNKPYAFAYLTKLAKYKLITNEVVFVKVHFEQNIAGKTIFEQTTVHNCFCVRICFSVQTLKSLEKTELNRIRFNSVLFVSVG